MPIVALEVGKRQSHRYGVIKQPDFVVQGWASPEDVTAGRKAKAAKSAPTPIEAKPKSKTEMEELLDDELPDWGQKQKAGA
jgi:hypothetical protein